MVRSAAIVTAEIFQSVRALSMRLSDYIFNDFVPTRFKVLYLHIWSCHYQSWGQFLFINSKFHSNSFLSIPESIPIRLVLRKVNSNSIPIPKKSIPYQFHLGMRLLIHMEQLYNNLIYNKIITADIK